MDQLSPLDAAFLRLETADVHMHVGWVSLFVAPHDRPRPTAQGLRASIAARIPHLPRFRQRVAFPPGGLADPFWVDDPGFDVAAHVLSFTGPDEPVALEGFAALADAVLSEPLDRRRPLWQFVLVPRLADGRVGLISKLHHALVDGVAAMELGAILFDATPDAALPPPPDSSPPRDWPPGPVGLSLASARAQVGLAARSAARVVEALSGPAPAAAEALRQAQRIVALGRQTVSSPAPASPLNRPIGPVRRLLRHRASAGDVLDVRTASGATFNDVCLAVVAGGLRELAHRHFGASQPLRALVPVNARAEDDHDAFGNRLSFAFVDLPLDVDSAPARLEATHAQTQRLKREGLTLAAAPVIAATSFLPPPLKAPLARLATADALFNLVVSTVPGPRLPIYMLGARLDEAYPFAPLAPDHALAIAVLSYCDGAFFGCHADPVALPQVADLPALLGAELTGLLEAYGVRPAPLPPGQPRTAPAPAVRPA